MKLSNEGEKRARGRPRKFVREQALERAMEVFWRQGYEGASVADLTAAMGINTPSLYGAFGSKEQLFAEVMAVYRARNGGMEALAEEPSARRFVERVLAYAAREFTRPDTPRGCLISTAVLACAPENREAARAAADQRAATLAIMTERLARAEAEGELPAPADAHTLARFYGAVLQGMSVQAQDGADEAALNGIARMALEAWPSTRE